MAGVPRQSGVSYAGLVLNRRGFDRALATGVDEVNVVVCASDTFSQRNQNASTDESLAAAIDVVRDARAAGLFTTVSIATAFGCPFEGEVAIDRVLDLARRSADAGADEICFADTIGVGVPTQVRALTEGFRATHDTALRYHFHNTRNTGYANAAAAIDAGVTTLDASAGGIGGCPFAPRATGNIATEDLIYLVERMGMSTGWRSVGSASDRRLPQRRSSARPCRRCCRRRARSRHPLTDRGSDHPRSDGADNVPRIAVAAATTGDTRWVRPPLPCRPSKLRLDVDAHRSPGAN